MLYLTRFLFPEFLFWHLAATSTLDSVQDLPTDFPERQLPSLTAITVRPDVQKCGESFIPKQDCEHHYADRMLFPAK